MSVTEAVHNRIRRNIIIEDYQEFVCKIASTLINRMRFPVQMFEELVAAGNLGLVEAAERYDPQANTEFKTFAYPRIRGSMIDALRECNELSGRAYYRAKAMQAMAELRNDLDKANCKVKPTAHSSKKERLAEIMDYIVDGTLVYKLCMGEAERELKKVKAAGADPQSKIETAQVDHSIKKAIRKLPAEQRKIIREYYFKDRDMQEIADLMGFDSKSWISRLHSRAVSNLRASLLEYYDGNIQTLFE